MKFISPWAKKIMIDCIFYITFFQKVYYIFLRVGKKYVSIWSKTIMIGQVF